MTIQKVEKLRADIAAKQAERATVEALPESREQKLAALRVFVTRLAAEGERSAAWRVSQGELAGLMMVRSGPSGLVDLAPMLAGLLGADTLFTLLSRHLADAPEGITHAERVKRLATIDAEIHTLGVAEEKAIRALHDAGTRIARRAEADPAVVLVDL